MCKAKALQFAHFFSLEPTLTPVRILIFSSMILIVNTAPALSQNLKVFSTACETATGSVSASDNLKKLKSLDPEIPGLQEAISRCEAHVNQLRQLEDYQWKQAIAERDASNCAMAKRLFQQLYQKASFYKLQARDELNKLSDCTTLGPQGPVPVGSSVEDANLLQRAAGAFNARDFDQARRLAQQLESRGGSTGERARELLKKMDTIASNNKKFQSARIAIVQREFAKACQLLLQIESSDPSFPGLARAKEEAGGCSAPAPEPDPLKLEYEKALRLIETKNLTEAKRVLKRISLANRQYPGVAQLQLKVDELMRKETQKKSDQGVDEIRLSVESSLRQGDLEAAASKLASVRQLRPSDKSLKLLQQRIEERVREEQQTLLGAIGTFYAGEYPLAQKQLSDFLRQRRTKRHFALARFYLGVVATTEYYLTGATDKGKKESAIRFFKELVREFPDFSPQWNIVSPKVKTLYLEAKRQTSS